MPLLLQSFGFSTAVNGAIAKAETVRQVNTASSWLLRTIPRRVGKSRVVAVVRAEREGRRVVICNAKYRSVDKLSANPPLSNTNHAQGIQQRRPANRGRA